MSEKYSIHRLEPCDKQTIDCIANWYFHEWQTPKELTFERFGEANSTNTIVHFIVKYNDVPVAAGGLSNKLGLHILHPEYSHIKPCVALVWTEPAHRNKGIARLLLKEIENFAISKELYKLYLYTNTAEELYLKCGWKPIQRIIYIGKRMP